MNLSQPERGLTFQQVQAQEGATLSLTRGNPPLQVVLRKMAPAIASLTVVSAPPPRLLDDFADEAEMVLSAYRATWPSDSLNVIRRDCTVRYLFGVKADHAFRDLWERRLSQRPESLQALGRPVLGGGVRFVLPPRDGVQDDTTIDTRIESFFQDPKKLFLEAQVLWASPMQAGAELRLGDLLRHAADFVAGPLTEFMTLEQ